MQCQNDIPLKIPSHPYVLVNRSVWCNCGIEVENNFLLESLVACHNAESKLVMYFTMITAFANYLDNLTESFKLPLLLNRTTHEQTSPISLKSFEFDSDLLKAPKTLKDFVHQFQHKKEIFDLKERHNNNDLDLANKNFFFNNYTIGIFLLVTAIISLVVTTIFMCILCKHIKLKYLVAIPALQQIKEVGMVAKQEISL